MPSKADYLAKYTTKKKDVGGDYVKPKKKRKKKGKKKKQTGLKMIDEDYDWKNDNNADSSMMAAIATAKAEGATIVSMEDAMAKQKEEEDDMIFKNARIKRNDGSGWVTVDDGAGNKRIKSKNFHQK